MIVGPKSVRVRSGFRGAFTGAYGLSGGVPLPLFELSGALTNSNLSGSVSFPLFSIGGRGIESNGGDIPVPLFQVAGSVVPGEVVSGALALRPLTAAGGLTPGSGGAITFPLFTTAGDLSIEGDTAGAVAIPLFAVAGVLHGANAAAATQVWVVNTRTKDHSIYTAFDCSGVFKFNGVWLGLFPDGVYELTGSTDGDEPVPFTVMWPPSDFGTAKQKRIDALYLNARLIDIDTLRFVAVADELTKRAYVKSIAGRPPGVARVRQQLTRGLQGQTWQFGVDNVSGGEVTITDILVETVPLSRTVK